MKVIVAGAGNVGMASAKAASAYNEVLVLEKDAEKADIAKNVLPVSVMKGDASNPKTLKGAIDKFHPDVILSAVKDDSMNLFICMMAKRLMPDIRTIATIRDNEFVIEGGYPGVDSIIAPENINIDKIISMAMIENAINFSRFRTVKLCLCLFRVVRGADIIGKPFMDLRIPEFSNVIAVYRGKETITDLLSAEVHENDRLLVLGSYESLLEFNQLVGVKKPARSFVILGATEMGIAVASAIADSPGKKFVKIIDEDIVKCKDAARRLGGVIVVNGSVADPVFLRSESVDRSDVLISVTDYEEKNLLACMTSIRFGINKIISRYTTDDYEGIFKYAGIESIIGYHRVITNEVSQMLGSKDIADATLILDRPNEFIIKLKAEDKLPFRNKPLGDVYLPRGVKIAAIIRGDDIIYPSLTDRISKGDEFMLYLHDVDRIQLAKALGHEAPGL
ncbi:K+ transport systems, NAD-binding component [Thermoplasmatales archaeon BRNA1]|nr:K+ transport systems, NAD-binding component [Thermoplasmatales archaeon BRNA1]